MSEVPCVPRRDRGRKRKRGGVGRDCRRHTVLSCQSFPCSPPFSAILQQVAKCRWQLLWAALGRSSHSQPEPRRKFYQRPTDTNSCLRVVRLGTSWSSGCTLPCRSVVRRAKLGRRGPVRVKGGSGQPRQ